MKFIKVAPLIALLLILTAACAPTRVQTTPGNTADYLFYPPPPNPSHYQYLTTFSDSSDVQKKASKFFEFIAGDEQEKPRAIQKAYGVDIFEGVVYVCDFGAGVVVTLNLETREFGYIGLSGSGKLIKPINLKVDREERTLYVADNGRKQVVAFDLEGDIVLVAFDEEDEAKEEAEELEREADGNPEYIYKLSSTAKKYGLSLDKPLTPKQLGKIMKDLQKAVDGGDSYTRQTKESLGKPSSANAGFPEDKNLSKELEEISIDDPQYDKKMEAITNRMNKSGGKK